MSLVKILLVFCIVFGILAIVVYQHETGRQENTVENSKATEEPQTPQKAEPAPVRHELKVVTPIGWTVEENEKGRAALDLFMKYCPMLFSDYRGDIDSVTISKTVLTKEGKEYDYRYESYGWDKYYWINVYVNSNTRYIPSECGLWGNTFYYSMGKGKKPGLEIIKGILPFTKCMLNKNNFLYPIDEMDSIKF